MELLLDTRVFLWVTSDASVLSKTARAAIEDSRNHVYVSAAAVWEISIKYDLGKLTLPLAPAIYIPSRLSILGFKPLSITQEHALAVSGLPDRHRDPFDRIMIAQAQVEGYTFVTNDADSLAYPVNVLKAC